MRELHVSTQTTPVELAAFCNRLLPDEEIGGRPGADGTVVLYACSAAQHAHAYRGMRNVIAVRVAMDVVLQHVAGMPGAQPLLGNLAEQLGGDMPPKAGWLAPPLTVLARLYHKTMNAMPPGAAGAAMLHACSAALAEPDDAAGDALSREQELALEKLMERLVSLASMQKMPGKT